MKIAMLGKKPKNMYFHSVPEFHWNIFFSGIWKHRKSGISGKMPKKVEFWAFFLFSGTFLIFFSLLITKFIKKEKNFTEYRKTPLLVPGVDQFSNSSSFVLGHHVP
jgi:hypothetical protein